MLGKDFNWLKIGIKVTAKTGACMVVCLSIGAVMDWQPQHVHVLSA